MKREKGVRTLLCQAPFGPFRQKGPDLFFILLSLTWTLLPGCQQTCFIKEADLWEASARLGLPPALENDASAGVVPFLDPVSQPATVTDPERTPRFLTLQEAIAIALESGSIGSQSVRAPGVPTDDLVSFAGPGAGVTGSDAVRVFALQPAINGAGIEAALARFDAHWLTSMSWNTTDNPTQGLSSFSNGQGAGLSSILAKPLPTGGVAGITFSTDYQNLRFPPSGFFPVVNPSYTTNLQFGFEQPLLRHYGVLMNQILPMFPSSNLFPGLNGRPAIQSTEGILITRLRFDQQRADFERRVNFQLVNVEVAYWNLYGAYVNLFAAEQGLRMAHETWRVAQDKYATGNFDPARLAQTRAQYEGFRVERLQAVGRVLENERNLRVLMGLKMEDGTRLVPADAPTLAPFVPNWEAAFRDALSLRPELVMAREDLKARQLALLASKNYLKPDLRLQANYGLVGLGTRLDGNGTVLGPNGPETNNSLRSLASGDFVNWTVGLQMDVPIGYRYELAQVRQARLQLAMAYEILKDQEKKAHNILAKQYRQVIEAYKAIEIRRVKRQTQAKVLKLLADKVLIGTIDPTSREFGDSLLDAQRLWAIALGEEYQAVVDYNNALALFEFTKGTIQHHDRVYIAEGPVPLIAQVRAVEHERQRTAALVLNERSAWRLPLGSNPFLEQRLDNVAPPLPALWENGPNLDNQLDFPEKAPEPRPMPELSGPAESPEKKAVLQKETSPPAPVSLEGQGEIFLVVPAPAPAPPLPEPRPASLELAVPSSAEKNPALARPTQLESPGPLQELGVEKPPTQSRSHPRLGRPAPLEEIPNLPSSGVPQLGELIFPGRP